MAIFRVLAAALLFAALAAVVADLHRSLDRRTGLEFTTFRDAWRELGLTGLDGAKRSLQGQPPSLVDGLTEQVASVPVWLAIAVAGLALWVLAAARRRRSSGNAAVAAALADAASADKPPGLELAHALSSCRGALIGMAVFSGASNVLMLTGSMFMLQVYDRVLPSRSVPTLVGLAILVVVLFAAQGGLDLIRVRLMGRIGMMIDSALSERI